MGILISIGVWSTPDFVYAQDGDLVDACKMTTLGYYQDKPMAGHFNNTIIYGNGDTEQIFKPDDLYISSGRKSNVSIKRALSIFKCINDQTSIAGYDELGIEEFSRTGEIIVTEKFGDLQEIINNYQIGNNLDQTGIIDVPTSFMMGHDIGLISRKFNKNENNLCDPMKIFTSEKTLLISNIDSENSSDPNKESLNEVLKCIFRTEWNKYTDTDFPFKHLLDQPVTINTNYPSMIYNDSEGGIALIYNLGVNSGFYGQPIIPRNNSNGGENNFKITLEKCKELKFAKDPDKKKLYLKDKESGDYYQTANLILACLDQLEESKIRDYSSLHGVTSYDINQDTLNTDLSVAFQKSILYDSGKDSLFDQIIKEEIKLGTIEIETSFQMGIKIGEIIKKTETNIETLCTNSYVSFLPSHSISENNEGLSPYISDPPLFESDKNINSLGQLLSCLDGKLNIDKEIKNSSSFTRVIESGMLKSLVYADNEDMYITPEIDYIRTERIGVAISYELGKLFGQYGGTGKKPETLRELQKLDPCTEENASSLSDKVHLYSSQNINFMPRNPGILDWRDVGEDNSDECLTKSKLAASLIGRVIRFVETFVAIIAVIMFIYGGFLYVTAHGDDSQSQKALKTIYVGVGGIFIILMSRFITEILVPLSDDGISIDKSRAFGSDVIANQQIAAITNWLLGFSSFIAISMLIYGGYLWMVSGGDEAVETKAKSILRTALIGFVIIFSAYTITMVVLGGAGITN